MSFCFLTNCPKAGTYLMRQILGMRQEERSIIRLEVGRYRDIAAVQSATIYPTGISGHILPIPAMVRLSNGLPSFILYRNPRDIIVSWYYYVDKISRKHRVTKIGNSNLNYKDFEGEDRKNLLIGNLHGQMAPMLPWGDTDIIPLRYEGLLECPEEELAPVSAASGIDLDVLVERSRYRGGKTFRKGVAGEWRHEFSDKQKKKIDELYGDIMEAWGYD